MPSFDIVCEVDLQEVDNAVNQVAKEMVTRFDFRGGKSSIDFDRNGKMIKINADDEMKLRSIHQMLETRLAKRDIDCRVLQYQDTQEASGKLLKQNVTLRSGLNKEEAKKITKYIKDSGLKVQSQIQDNQVRVTGKQIDDLQEIIASLKAGDLGLPLQYVNMRR
ncbi:MAG: YajQ family cyclic di-GMP-binding protein [Deltaproteobacteria bacterium]|nr:YajQ family cyclic di-GMP-binding protein [Deltaproteobacteria bacterium]